MLSTLLQRSIIATYGCVGSEGQYTAFDWRMQYQKAPTFQTGVWTNEHCGKSCSTQVYPDLPLTVLPRHAIQWHQSTLRDSTTAVQLRSMSSATTPSGTSIGHTSIRLLKIAPSKQRLNSCALAPSHRTLSCRSGQEGSGGDAHRLTRK